MTDQNYPITPPPELVEQWYCNKPLDRGLTLATWAAQWGADQELEASLEWLVQEGYIDAPCRLRTARRPKPPSLKKQALHILDTHGDLTRAEADTIRRALEALDD